MGDSSKFLRILLSATLVASLVPAPALAEVANELQGDAPLAPQEEQVLEDEGAPEEPVDQVVQPDEQVAAPSFEESQEQEPAIQDEQGEQETPEQLEQEAAEPVVEPLGASAQPEPDYEEPAYDDTVTLVDEDEDTYLGSAPVRGEQTDADGPLTAGSYSQPQSRTKSQIKSFIENHPFDIYQSATFDVTPVTSSPYAAGRISGDTRQQALNALNVVRYVAGLNYNVTSSSTYENYAQAGSLVNAVNDELTHYPTQPSDMDDSLYQTGRKGTSSSNIGWGYSNPANSILGYADDTGDNNLYVAGHRQWILSSRLGQVGFGQVGRYTATYVFDGSDSSNITDVAWPARVMPTCLIDTRAQWSLSTMTSEVGSSVTVRVVRRRDGKVWNLSQSAGTVAVTSAGYGYDGNGAIIWSMEDVEAYLDGDVFDVTISGSAGTKSYSVEFFDLYPLGIVDMKLSGVDSIAEGQTITKRVSDYAFYTSVTTGIAESARPEDEGLLNLAQRALRRLSLQFTSSDPSVAEISDAYSSSFYVQPKGVGTTKITASLPDGTSRSFYLEVAKRSINPNEDRFAGFSETYDYFTYNGSRQHPTYTLTYDGATLTEGTDYTVKYSDDINAGECTVTITGKGEYEGTITTSYYINPVSSYNVDVDSPGDKTYTGSAITPKPAVTWNGTKLVEGRDFDYGYRSNVNVGYGYVDVICKGNFSGSTYAYFYINPLMVTKPTARTGLVYNGSSQVGVPAGSGYTLTGAASATNAGSYQAVASLVDKANYRWTDYSTDDVTISWGIERASVANATVSAIPASTFTGAALVPTFMVTVGGRTLTRGTDFAVAYANNTNVGTARVTVTGTGNYTGTKGIQFAINAANISGAAVDAIASRTYTGAALTPKPTVKFGGKTLAEGTDYLLSYKSNTNVGTATVTITGQGNFAGSKTVTFKIDAANIAQATVDAISAMTYTGKALSPKPAVRYGSKTLTEGTDYTLSYKNNTNAGTATVTITGKGNYTGSRQVTFGIAKAKVAVPAGKNGLVYTGAQQTGVVAGSAYTLSGATNGTNAGTYTATATLADTANYQWADGTTDAKSISWRIAAASLVSAKVTASNKTYTGKAIASAPTVKLGDVTLVSGTDYTVSYKDNVNAGKATVTVTGKGNYAGSASGSFTIAKAKVAVPTAATGLVYDGTEKVGVPTGANYKLVGSAKATKAGSYTAKATLADAANYQWADGSSAEKSIAWTIAPASVSRLTIASVDNQAYTGAEVKPAPAVKDGATTLKSGTDYTLSYKGNVNVGTATITVTGKGNYMGATAVTFKIVAASIGKAKVATVPDQRHTGKAITPEPAVTFGEKTLVKDVDYTLSYRNNVDVGDGAVITVRGKGNFTGTTTVTFEIKVATQEMYRLYNPNSGEHFYTAKAGERDHLVEVGWNYEGVGWIAPVTSKTPVYRLYNPIAGDHHYTTKTGERDALIKAKWVDEGIGWYSDDDRGVPLYRQYNPNAVTGTHNYTTNKAENDYLMTIGWKAEGIGWYGVKL